jgi:hypothetical protein
MGVVGEGLSRVVAIIEMRPVEPNEVESWGLWARIGVEVVWAIARVWVDGMVSWREQ